jgi:hypothetical protein
VSITCPDCGRHRRHHARGRCNACYWLARTHGRLDHLPRLRRPTAETYEEWLFLTSQGYTDQDVAGQLGVSVDALQQAIKRAERAPVDSGRGA